MKEGVNQSTDFWGGFAQREKPGGSDKPTILHSPATLLVTAADVLMICQAFNELEVECSVKCLFWWQFNDVST